MRHALIILAGFVVKGLTLSSTTHVVHEKRNVLHSPGWSKREPANTEQKVPVRIALKQRNLEKAMDYILEVSDPKSFKYGQHYTPDQVSHLFAPNQETIDSVKSWLVRSGISADKITLSSGRGWLTFETSVGKLQSLVKADYHVYEKLDSRDDHIGADAYSIPADVASFVDFVVPGTSFSKMPTTRSAKEEPLRVVTEPFVAFSKAEAEDFKAKLNGTEHCDQYITPQCIKAMYQIPNGTLSNLTNPMGIFEGLGDVFAQEDLDGFYENVAPGIPKGTGPDLALINGATAPNSQDKAGTESNLDFQMALPIIYPQTSVLYQVKSRVDIFLAFLGALGGDFCKENPNRHPGEMCSAFAATNVISISYGGPEEARSPLLLKRQCNEFMKLGLQGISVVVASGDDGVASPFGYCIGPHHDIFVPDNPSGCPYVTSVGSTYLPQGSKVGDPEVATQRFSSGGGFSNVFDTPKWQSAAVGQYLLRNNPNYFSYMATDGEIPESTRGVYNRNGRGYPDISAVGDNGVIYHRGKLGLVGGTSQSAPIVAAIFNRINEERLNLGKGPIGFANPALYQAYDNNVPLFNDVTAGDQRLGGAFGHRYPSACGNKGFSAVAGWDPVTGLGTPRYPEMLKYFVDL